MSSIDKKLDLIDELWKSLEDLPEGQGPGSLIGAWAARALEHETEERAAVVAFLQTAGAPKPLIEMIERGVHRQRSTTAMRALHKAKGKLDEDRRKYVEDICKEFVRR